MWTIVLPALGFSVTHLIEGGSFMLQDTWKGLPFFLYGTYPIVVSVWRRCKDWGKIVACLASGESPMGNELSGFRWFSLKHSSCDGVTSGDWWCGSSFKHEVPDYPKEM
jgi:hypothetical protein